MRRQNRVSYILTPAVYAAIINLILTLTGVFATFRGREVIVDILSLNRIILVAMLLGAGYATAHRARYEGVPVTILAGIAGSLISGLALALLVIFNIYVDMSDILVNVGNLNGSILTFDREVDLDSGAFSGLLMLLGFSAGLGLIGALLVTIPELLKRWFLHRRGPAAAFAHMIAERLRLALAVSVLIVVVMGLVFGQINSIITLPDALMFFGVFLAAYAIAWLLARRVTDSLLTMLVIGGFIGLALGGILGFMVENGGLNEDRILRDVRLFPTTTSQALVIRGNEPAFLRQQVVGVLRGTSDEPEILAMPLGGKTHWFLLVMTITGAAGAVAAGGSSLINNGAFYFLVSLLALGVLNWQREMTLLAAEIIFFAFLLLMLVVPVLGQRTERRFERAGSLDQQTARLLFTMIALGVLVVAPQFVNLYVSNVLNWIALYVVMGMGLNVMIGFTGLLDLGYVASFAIGAYTLGILTAPNILTCGGVDPSEIPFSEISSVCTGTLTFWQAWPICVIVSASTGMLLGVPVLGLRGDYLAIVTLGFGEITNRVIKSNATSDLLGGAQGISPIPVPEIDLTAISDNWQYVFSGSSSVFYLYLFSVVFTAFIVWRLSRSRLGRAWRAIRADEDVAEAMGIDLVKYKLLAFGVSSAFAGLGGAVFGVQLQGIFPDSFTILVSINVLSLIILGGMGSLAGVVLGAIVLVGLPELLRELGAYRLMGYGALLVIVMLTKPEGLLPPSPPKLTEKAERSRSEATPEQTGVFAGEPRTEGAD